MWDKLENIHTIYLYMYLVKGIRLKEFNVECINKSKTMNEYTSSRTEMPQKRFYTIQVVKVVIFTT